MTNITSENEEVPLRLLYLLNSFMNLV